MTPVRVVWTDFGGVLTPPVADTLATLCANHGLDRKALLAAMSAVAARYGTDDAMEPLDTPLTSERDWLRQISEELGGALRLTTLADTWFDGRETNTSWVAQLRALRGRGIGVSLLSNMVPAWDAHWRRMVDVDGLFDHVVLSFEAGHRKPTEEIFAFAARRAGVHPSECVLVDDLERNCAGAEAAGWRAVHFTGTESAAARLRQLLSPVTGGVR
ncbi:HAD family hydrolase [Nocardia sp. CA-120079]|uniref:HAD family hydrolase n=1 Tax=Nocardia sp. CA-120079 TaxID=3239974 RepID=UPI003D99908B